ncbi:MAG: 2TM domain-containing protein [Bacteroidota bacterium]
MNTTNEKEKYKIARKKVAEKKGFYQHLIYFGAFAVLFFILNMIRTPGRIWFHYPILGWGIGLLIHYLNVFGIPLLGDKWEEKEIEKEIGKMEENSDHFSFTEKEEKMELKELRKNYDENDLV